MGNNFKNSGYFENTEEIKDLYISSFNTEC
jgi:hypothetical protein